MKKRGKGKKKISIKKIVAYLSLILLFLLGMAGVEYQSTGTINHTKALVENLAGYVSDGVKEKVEDMTDWESEPESDSQPDTESEALNDIEIEWTEEEFESDEEFNVDSFSSATVEETENVASLYEIPEYTGETYVTVNGNIPEFTVEQYQSYPYEYYGDLDELGRCTIAEAKISQDLMPTEERGAIGMVKPTGWHTVKYDNIDGKYLYNRCHLIGYQLTGENANRSNLITGTRYLNVIGMLPWENLVTDYIKTTGDMVLYRVTPIYNGNELVARGVQMEAESMATDQIAFNIFVFNIQPGIGIDYQTGDSWLN